MYGGPEYGGYSGNFAYEEKEHGKLKPCPFCGNRELEVTNTHTASYWVECLECGAEVSGEYGGDGFQTETAFRAGHELALRSAVKAWNRRA